MRTWVKVTLKFFALFWQLFCTFTIISIHTDTYHSPWKHLKIQNYQSQILKINFISAVNIKIIKIKKRSLKGCGVIIKKKLDLWNY